MRWLRRLIRRRDVLVVPPSTSPLALVTAYRTGGPLLDQLIHTMTVDELAHALAGCVDMLDNRLHVDAVELGLDDDTYMRTLCIAHAKHGEGTW